VNWPRTLFCRTTLVIAIVSVVFQVFAIGAIAYFTLVPLGRRAAEDVAVRMMDVARDWSRLPASAREDFQSRVLNAYEIRVGRSEGALADFSKWLPYYFLVEDALEHRLGRHITLRADTGNDGQQWLWADIPTESGPVWVGFSSQRIGVYPPAALALILVVGTAATLITSAYLARRLTAPLRHLSNAARRVGAGDCPEPLPGGGPEEFDTCVHSFNHMVEQVQELLAARTTLLAGISHDLRTPLARMRMALGMLSDGHDPGLVQQLMCDVDAMNELIGRCLELGRGLEEPPATVDPGALLEEIAVATRRAGHAVDYDRSPPIKLRLRSLALCRITENLLENALRYGGGHAPCLEFDTHTSTVRVLDRGPGIPEAEREKVFRPFYRLDPSRSNATGGSGLGLAIVRQLANANGWRVWLESRPGGGTAACVQIHEGGAPPTDCILGPKAKGFSFSVAEG